MKVMNLTLRQARLADAPMLAILNHELIRAEQSENPMNLAQLTERMVRFLQEQWEAQILLSQGEIVGYALYQTRSNEANPEQLQVYLRQYMIRDAYRRRGYGRAGIRLLQSNAFPASTELIIDVLESNPEGRRFWASLGFAAYCTTMKLQVGQALSMER